MERITATPFDAAYTAVLTAADRVCRCGTDTALTVVAELVETLASVNSGAEVVSFLHHLAEYAGSDAGPEALPPARVYGNALKTVLETLRNPEPLVDRILTRPASDSRAALYRCVRSAVRMLGSSGGVTRETLSLFATFHGGIAKALEKHIVRSLEDEDNLADLLSAAARHPRKVESVVNTVKDEGTKVGRAVTLAGYLVATHAADVAYRILSSIGTVSDTWKQQRVHVAALGALGAYVPYAFGTVKGNNTLVPAVNAARALLTLDVATTIAYAVAAAALVIATSGRANPLHLDAAVNVAKNAAGVLTPYLEAAQEAWTAWGSKVLPKLLLNNTSSVVDAAAYCEGYPTFAVPRAFLELIAACAGPGDVKISSGVKRIVHAALCVTENVSVHCTTSRSSELFTRASVIVWAYQAVAEMLKSFKSSSQDRASVPTAYLVPVYLAYIDVAETMARVLSGKLKWMGNGTSFLDAAVAALAYAAMERAHEDTVLKALGERGSCAAHVISTFLNTTLMLISASYGLRKVLHISEIFRQDAARSLLKSGSFSSCVNAAVRGMPNDDTRVRLLPEEVKAVTGEKSDVYYGSAAPLLRDFLRAQGMSDIALLT